MQVRTTKDRGRAIFATKAHRQGEVVFRETPVLVRRPAELAGPLKALAAAAKLLRSQGQDPQAATLAWDFVAAFRAATDAERNAVLSLYHPELSDTSPKVALAVRVASLLFKALPEPVPFGLEELQRGLLVDLFNNFDGALLELGCRLNHACAPLLSQSDFGCAEVDGQAVPVAFACWNEHLDYKSGLDAQTAPLTEGAAIAGAVAVAAAGRSVRESLARLARRAESEGAVALLVMLPADVDVEGAMASRWGQPSARQGCPRIPAFCLGGGRKSPPSGSRFVVHSSAGKEFRASRDIRAGEELTISYLGKGAGKLPTSERRAYLQGAYGFCCQCRSCGPRRRAGRTVRPKLGKRGRLRRLRHLSVVVRRLGFA